MVLGSTTHFELLARRGRRWVVIDVLNERKAAVERAEEVWAGRQYDGVRLTKETFNKADGSFTTVDLFNRGQVNKGRKAEVANTISPCLTPNDIYSADGRRTIWSLLHNTLSDWSLTPTELLHHLEHYYKLYNAGMKLEDAIQRTVVAYEDDSDSIQLRMRKLQKLIDNCVEIAKRAEEGVPALEEGRLKPLITQLEDKQNRSFLLISSIARYLKPAMGVEDKLGRLIVFVSKNQPHWVQVILDQIIAELLQIDRLLRILISDRVDHKSYLCILAHLAGGSLDEIEDEDIRTLIPRDILDTNKGIKNGLLPDVRRVVKTRLEKEIAVSKPLGSSDVIKQVEALAELREIVLEQQFEEVYLDTIEEEINRRMARVLSPQAIGDHLTTIEDPFEQINFLIDLVNASLGENNKRVIANSVLPVLDSPKSETAMMGLGGKPLARMPQLVELQRRVIQSDMSEMHKRKISEKLDTFCKSVLDNTDLLRKIHEMPASYQDKALRLLTLLAEDYFTDGDARSRAEAQTLIYMRQPNFTDKLIAARPGDRPEAILIEFRDLLKASGLTRRHERQQQELEKEELEEQKDPENQEKETQEAGENDLGDAE